MVTYSFHLYSRSSHHFILTILIYRNWSIYTEREDQPSPPEREREVFVRAWERFDCHEVRAKIE